MNIKLSDDFYIAQTSYNKFREAFIQYLDGFDIWDEYRDYLNSKNIRYDKSNFIEKYILEFYAIITNNFLEKYPYLRKYSHPTKNHLYIYSKRGSVKVKVELYNGLNISDLYYPNMKRCINLHSARHSVALFLQEKDNPHYINSQFALYMRPLLTHPGDKEYTLYYISMYNFPMAILTRQENLSWLLQVNGLHKKEQGGGGRWCTRVFKIEPARLFYREFFYSWQYKLTSNELKEYCKKYNISYKSNIKKNDLVQLIENRLKSKSFFTEHIPSPNKNKYVRDITKYPLYKYNSYYKEWAMIDTITNEFPEYEKVTETVGNSKRFKGWRKTGDIIKVNNLIQLIGINKYHSGKRRIDNPNMCYAPLCIKYLPKHFYIYQYYPIYDITPEHMQKIINSSKIPIKNNPFEQEHNISYEKEIIAAEKEQRFGCIICPYKQISYYKDLMQNYPFQYFYCMSIRLIASAKNILREGREYWYDRESKII